MRRIRSLEAIYFRHSALLILRQGIVRFTSSNCDAPTNQNTCYKKIALESVVAAGNERETKDISMNLKLIPLYYVNGFLCRTFAILGLKVLTSAA